MSDRPELRQQWLQQLFDNEPFTLTPASEDASFRSYYRAQLNDRSYILMDAPPQHEDCRPFIDITQRLLACDVNVPQIHEQDLEQGFLLLSDLGDDQYLPHLQESQADSLYRQAIDSLVRFQLRADIKQLPEYDETLLQREMNLFQDWLLKQYLQIALEPSERQSLTDLQQLLIVNAQQQPQLFVHRDYHSRNLMLSGGQTPGILDYQDAVIGPLSYDLVSLLKDSYVYWEPGQRSDWIDYYLQQLQQQDHGLQFDRTQFQRWFDLMGVQRELKVGGIFARLWLRDNKAGFLQDIPRTLNYIVELKDRYAELDWLITLLQERVLPALEQQP